MNSYKVKKNSLRYMYHSCSNKLSKDEIIDTFKTCIFISFLGQRCLKVDDTANDTSNQSNQTLSLRFIIVMSSAHSTQNMILIRKSVSAYSVFKLSSILISIRISSISISITTSIYSSAFMNIRFSNSNTIILYVPATF